jgi:putative tricarboxylic transport membrane protein
MKADFWSGLALGALGVYIVAQAWGWEYLGPDGPGPGFFPLWYGIAMAGLSLVLVFASLKAQPNPVNWSGASRAFITWIALAVAVAAFKLAGFLICFAALTFFIVAVMYRRRLVVAATVAVAAAAAFYVLFPLALGVQLP